jgi:hypothetical protein
MATLDYPHPDGLPFTEPAGRRELPARPRRLARPLRLGRPVRLDRPIPLERPVRLERPVHLGCDAPDAGQRGTRTRVVTVGAVASGGTP